MNEFLSQHPEIVAKIEAKKQRVEALREAQKLGVDQVHLPLGLWDAYKETDPEFYEQLVNAFFAWKRDEESLKLRREAWKEEENRAREEVRQRVIRDREAEKFSASREDMLELSRIYWDKIKDHPCPPAVLLELMENMWKYGKQWEERWGCYDEKGEMIYD